MPLQVTVAQARLNRAITGLTGAVQTLEVFAYSFKTPFLQPISTTARSLLSGLMNVKRNREDCSKLMEQTYRLLYGIISLHISSETEAELLPSQLNNLGKFTETLHKVHSFVEAQQDKIRIKDFFRQGEMATLLKECNTGLQQGLDAFKIQDTNLVIDVGDFQRYAEERHKEAVQLVENLSDPSFSDTGSSRFFGFGNSSTSISILPPEPKIFHGLQSEISEILSLFTQETVAIAILGPGGMGKTSLAKAILHHPDITGRYHQQRFFVACDAVSTSIELAAQIGEHLGLKAGTDLTAPIGRYFANNPASVLFLDNLETAWEPVNTRGDIEEFLSLLTQVQHLALVITMRGAERPAKVRWSRPFLAPLLPLGHDAARQTFMDIADDAHSVADIDKILVLTDNLPLAIDLIAHLADSEGCSYVLSRWEEEKTSLLSDGFDRRSNLDLSISLSLASPRLASRPHARELLSLLSILPDGLSDVELLQSKLPIADVLSSKTALLSTALSHNSNTHRLRTLVPIREYMKQFYPPSADLLQPLLKYFQELLELYKRYSGTLSSSAITAQITSNFSNIQNILVHGLDYEGLKVTTMYCIVHLNHFSMGTGRGWLPLLDQVSDILPQFGDHSLMVSYLTLKLESWRNSPTDDVVALANEAEPHLADCNDSDLTCSFYVSLGRYYSRRAGNMSAARTVLEKSLSLACSTGNTKRHSQILKSLADMDWDCGHYSLGQTHASEAQRLAKMSGDLWSESDALRIQGICCLSVGNYTDAVSLCNQARDLLVLCGMEGGDLDYSLRSTQADAHKLKSEYVEALHLQTQILHSLDIQQEASYYAFISLNIAELDLTLNAPKDVVQAKIDTAKSIFSSIDFSLAVTMCDTIQAELWLRERDFAAANRLFQQCLKACLGVHAEVQIYILERLANRQQWRTAHWAPSWITVLLVCSLKSNQNREMYRALQFLGELFGAENDKDTSAALLTVALQGFTSMDIHRSRAECMLKLGEIARDQGNRLKALTLWKEAIPLFERSSQEMQVALVKKNLKVISGGALQ